MSYAHSDTSAYVKFLLSVDLVFDLGTVGRRSRSEFPRRNASFIELVQLAVGTALGFGKQEDARNKIYCSRTGEK
jgi:hypothetical protein